MSGFPPGPESSSSCRGLPHPRFSSASAATMRAIAGVFFARSTFESPSIASTVCARASSRTSSGTFGRPFGFPLLPGLKPRPVTPPGRFVVPPLFFGLRGIVVLLVEGSLVG
jgi:hypothetical protein